MEPVTDNSSGGVILPCLIENLTAAFSNVLKWCSSAALVIGPLILSGCVANPKSTDTLTITPAYPQSSLNDLRQSWHQQCFRFRFDEAGEPDFTLDLILADQVIKPVLEAESDAITFWRFHRRAANDRSGHQFSFFYFSSDETKVRINTQIESNPVLNNLIAKDVLIESRNQCRAQTDLKRPGALSDQSWAPVIQKSWPVFIMGVSAAWLNLIEAISQEIDSDIDNDDIYAHYSQVEARLIDLWQTQGQHAYLHHLNAIFGYEPLFIKKWMRF